MTNQTYPTSPMLRNLITGIVIINNRQLNTFFSFHDKISRDSQRYLLQEILRNMPDMFCTSLKSSVRLESSQNPQLKYCKISNWNEGVSWCLNITCMIFVFRSRDRHVHRVSEMIWPQRALPISFVTHSNPVPEIKIKSPLY